MKLRVSPLATLLVALAVVTMVALGVWQLHRHVWKQERIARYAANATLPPMAFPRPPVGEEYLYRRASAFCLSVTQWQSRAGRDAQGRTGYRLIAECRTGAEGPGLKVEMGVTPDPGTRPQWNGGRVTGTIAAVPGERPVIASLLDKSRPLPLMLVSDVPAPGLAPSARPDPARVPDNHLFYAAQWFLFAVTAIALWLFAARRGASARKPPDATA